MIDVYKLIDMFERFDMFDHVSYNPVYGHYEIMCNSYYMKKIFGSESVLQMYCETVAGITDSEISYWYSNTGMYCRVRIVGKLKLWNSAR